MGGPRLGDATPGMAAVTSIMRAQQILLAGWTAPSVPSA